MSKFIVISGSNTIIEILGTYIREQNMEVFKSDKDTNIPNVKFYPNFQTLEAAKDYLISSRIQKLKELSEKMLELQEEYKLAIEQLEKSTYPDIKVLE